ncbi:hypothetical protein M5689_000677 [Euphorbia peplus]|nr:hypothetical protein M5689_000677 [Euphorbia peplus]
MATIAILNPKCINSINTNKKIKPSSITKPISFPPIQTLPKGLSLSSSITKPISFPLIQTLINLLHLELRLSSFRRSTDCSDRRRRRQPRNRAIAAADSG